MKKITGTGPEEALNRLQKICSQKEICIRDAKNKLKTWGLKEEYFSNVIDRLVEEKFINEERYVKFFISDKQKFNKWGSEKIRFALIQKGIDKDLIASEMDSLSEEGFESSLRELLIRKKNQLKGHSKRDMKIKLIRFAAQKGFDFELIYRITDEVLED